MTFSLVYAYTAAHNRRLRRVLVPALDILQSVPVLGYLSVTITFFLTLFPHSVLGLEAASVFAVFTAQAWNMTFSFYQSLTTLPRDMDEASRVLRLSRWKRFWSIELPNGAIGLVWNGMMSFGGSWFFLTASEQISVPDHGGYVLPGIGSYVGVASARGETGDVVLAIAVMIAMVVLVNVLFWRPLTAYVERFRVEESEATEKQRSLVLGILRRSALPGLIVHGMNVGLAPVNRVMGRITGTADRGFVQHLERRRAGDIAFFAVTLAVLAFGLYRMLDYVGSGPDGLGVFAQTFGLGFLTFSRVVVLLIVATIVWVPIGVWIGFNPRVTRLAQPVVQVLASFPANFLFPFAIALFGALGIGLDFGGIVLMALGAQWYILFNVIAGASAVPSDLREAMRNLGVTGPIAVAAPHHPRYLPRLYHRRDHRSRRRLERFHRCGDRAVPRTYARGTWARRVHRTGHVRVRLPQDPRRAAHHVRLRRRRQLVALAPPLPARGNSVLARMTSPGSIISVRHVTKSFAGAGDKRIPVLEGIDLEVGDSEFVALLGRSGSGKSTLLRCIAGLIAPTSGEVLYRGARLLGCNPGTAMVFQSFALLPWLSVQQNVEIGLEARGVPPRRRAEQALRAIDIVGLDGYESAFPKELSGGMRQRVGFARALVLEPDVLLMDEPFSALDVLTAENLRGELLELWEGHRFPTRSVVMVTHNIEEAVLLADRILVLGTNPGRLRAELVERGSSPAPSPHAGLRRARRPHLRDHDRHRGAGRSRRQAALRSSTARLATPRSRWRPSTGSPGLPRSSTTATVSCDLADLARLLGLEVDDMLPLVDALVLLGLATLSGDTLALTPDGRAFAGANIQESKRIFATQALERAPLVRTIDRALRGSKDGNLPSGFFTDLLHRNFGEDEARQQMDTAINWGRYAELYAFDGTRGQLSLEEHEGQPFEHRAGARASRSARASCVSTSARTPDPGRRSPCCATATTAARPARTSWWPRSTPAAVPTPRRRSATSSGSRSQTERRRSSRTTSISTR